ncbi:unnamed protein product [Brachionus calyciflorus]|uniref:LamG domain-containing protein n=1 Tax=Brachionus calyciflorus TaxID=104777 RepID=A0A813P9R0_9BILA|nr:unnamed protein product [Brachionus calyciflorus]
MVVRDLLAGYLREIHYWPIFNSSTNDIISNADLYEPHNAFFIPNRMGFPNSAISLLRGYYNLPPRNYFNGDFTIMTWVKLTDSGHFQRFIDCGIDKYKAVYISLSSGLTNKPHFKISYDSDRESFYALVSDNSLVIGVWYHLTFIFKENFGYYYRNGVLDKSGILDHPMNITRTICYLGKSQYTGADPDISADFDEIKIFNRALNADEIFREYKKPF